MLSQNRFFLSHFYVYYFSSIQNLYNNFKYKTEIKQKANVFHRYINYG